MIIDHRTYDILPGRLKDYVALYEKKGWPMQKKHLGNCIGWYTSNDIGELNQIVHMWAYESLDDRARRRAAMLGEPQWLEFLAESAPLMIRMRNKILTAAPFFTPR